MLPQVYANADSIRARLDAEYRAKEIGETMTQDGRVRKGKEERRKHLVEIEAR